MSDIVDKVRELSRIKADIAKLNDRRKELEAYFLEHTAYTISPRITITC